MTPSRVAVLPVLALVAWTGCSRCGPAETANRPAPKVFGVAIWEPESIDPGLAAEEAGVTISRALFEGLLARPAGNGPMRPGVAESWESTPDGLRWTFRLRADARWSDGRPVVAGDFAYAWLRVLDPATGSRSASQLYFMDGAQAVQKGAAGARLGVETPDDRTLIVRLHAPVPYFESVVTYPAWFPVRRDVVEAHGARWTRPENIVTNGPFRLDSFQAGVEALLSRSPTWWNAGSVRLDGAAFRFVANERTAYEWFRSGRVHWLKSTLARDLIPEMRRTRPPEFHTDPVLCTYYAAMRVTAPPLDDVRLRHALDLAVDKERLVREVLMGGQAAATGIVPPAILAATGYRPPVGKRFDAAAARALLAEHVRERGPVPPLTYLYNTGEAHRLIAEFLQAEWKTNLGLEVAVRSTEWKSLLARVRTGDYHLARASWCADYVDPGNFLEVFETGNPNNYPGFSSPVLDRAVARARGAVSWNGRLPAYAEAEQVLIEGAPIVPLYFYTRIYLLDPGVTGFEPNMLDVHPLDLLDFRAP